MANYFNVGHVATCHVRSTSLTLGSDVVQVPHGAIFRRRFMKVCASTIFGGLSSCSEPGADLPPLKKTGKVTYHLGPGDHVRVITLFAPELTGEFQVNDSGDLALPLIGAIRANDLTPKEVEASVVAKLTQMKLLQDPNVSVEIVKYRPIFVLGEVSKPGEYAYQPGMTVVTAVAIAGGFTYRAITDRFSVVRSSRDDSTEGRAGRQDSLQPGDVLTVYERYF